ncbi:AraC family transcriptional regulator [Ideonella dechloratans]|uniref:AraC family transcriptional regulator n=1 Tax=Ideonella dechloratans TaxID=36863 RepID=UPI0035ADBF23
MSDPLSDVLQILRPRTYMFRAIDAGGAWSLRFPGLEGIRCYAVTRGEIWMQIDGEAGPRVLREGSCLVLTRNQAFRMGSRLDHASEDAVGMMSSAPWGGVVTINGGGEVYGLGGFFLFEGRQANQLLKVLPAVIHLEGAAENAALRAAMGVIMSELREQRPGGRLVAEQMALSMFVMILRQPLAGGTEPAVGWLQALGDPKVGRALKALHAAPGNAWTLALLAHQAGMSRSAFAAHFRRLVGESAMGYLQHWRMSLAADLLLHSRDRIGEIAARVGYESDSAFCSVFKKVFGSSPREYRRQWTQAASAVVA